MWSSLIRIQTILQNICPLRVIFCKDNATFSSNPLANTPLKMRVVEFNISLVIISCIIGLKRILDNSIPLDLPAEEIKIRTQKMVLGAVLFILLMTLYSNGLTSVCTFKYRTTSAIFMMNQARGLFLDRLNNPNKILGAPTKRQSVLFGVLLYNLMMACLFALVMVTMFPVISHNNPANVMLSLLLPKNIFEGRPILIKIVSCLYMGISGYFGVFTSIQALSFIVAVLYEAKFLLKRAYNYDDNFAVKKSTYTFHHQWIIYSQNIILIREFNRYGDFLYPGVILTSFWINVVTTTVCMKFYHELPSVLLFLFLGFDAVVAIATVVVHSFGVVAKEESESFRVYWKSRLFSKLAQRQLRACIPTPINIGPFFELQRSTILNTVVEVINMVLTFLLADE